MKPKSRKGPRSVGGASPQSWEAPAAVTVDRTKALLRTLMAAHPAHAAAAALSWQANQAVTRLVAATFTASMQSRQLAEALAAAADQTVPAGPLRSALTEAAKGQIAAANATAELATAFGRRFGRLAFAFPRPGAL